MEQLLIDTDTFSLSQGDFLIRILVSIGIGIVIGLERQYSAIKEHAHGYFGIRTFTFYSLLGCIAGIFYFIFSPWIYLGLFFGLVSLTALAYWQTALQGDRGMTTELSAVLTFVLGSMAAYGLIAFSLMITVVVLLFLSSKFRFQTLVGKITAAELYAFVRFVVLALLILPFLPNTPFGPYAVLNPKEIGWIVLLTSGFGFLGYILIKTFGAHRGILLGGLLGGLVSSTSITWIYARKSKENPSLSDHVPRPFWGLPPSCFFALAYGLPYFPPCCFAPCRCICFYSCLSPWQAPFSPIPKAKEKRQRRMLPFTSLWT